MFINNSPMWLLTVISFVAACGQIGCQQSLAADEPSGGQGEKKGFAIVELFTSEGCSSCPSADDVLADMVKDARRNGTRVYPISFHVDYWNQLGWTDRFSTAAYSRRQSEYARALQLDQVYTPQAIVNGQTEFVGSNREKLHSQVAEALKQAATASVKIELQPESNGRNLVVHYTVGDAPSGSVLNVAAVERKLQTKVAAGENSGRTLKHENVVRVFTPAPLSETEMQGNLTLKLPSDALSDNVTVIGYVQNAQSMQILGADGIDVKPVQQRAAK